MSESSPRNIIKRTGDSSVIRRFRVFSTSKKLLNEGYISHQGCSEVMYSSKTSYICKDSFGLRINSLIPKTPKLEEKSMNNRSKILNYMTCLLVDFSDAVSMYLFEEGLQESCTSIWVNEGDTRALQDKLRKLLPNTGNINAKLYGSSPENDNIVVSLSLHSSGDSSEVVVNGLYSEVAKIKELILSSDLSIKPPKIKRVCARASSITDSVSTLQEVKDFDWQHFYPHLDKSPEEIATEFKDSGANVLLLIGLPGTGKSNFLRRIMDHYGYDNLPYVVDNEDLLLNPDMITYLQSKEDLDLFVAEDADNFVSKRSDHNRSMVGLLNMTSGVAQSRGKVILSTNLSNISKVDEALLRPGRCFQVIEFQKLTKEQAQKVSNIYGSGRPVEGELTLAEAINGSNGKTEASSSLSFGFGG